MGILGGFKRALSRIHFEYLGGHPDLPRRQLVGIEREENYLNFCHGDKTLARIPLAAIKSVQLERSSSRSVGKAAVGAIAGGVLLGPIGAITGGTLGARKKKEDIIVITIQEGPTEFQVLLGGEHVEQKYPKLISLLKH
ncbi:MAG: hypothetical protein H3Z53_01985 [archaeon]|nr:hypothetical protein [archaeon]